MQPGPGYRLINSGGLLAGAHLDQAGLQVRAGAGAFRWAADNRQVLRAV